MQNINIRLTEQQPQSVIELLNQGLVDSYLLLIKMRKYHWNTVGCQYIKLHQLWQEHDESLTLSIDTISERIKEMESSLNLRPLEEHLKNVPTATDIVSELLKDHEQIVQNLQKQVEQCSHKFEDNETANFLISLMKQHIKMAWMLRSFIEGEAVEADRLKPGSKKKIVEF